MTSAAALTAVNVQRFHGVISTSFSRNKIATKKQPAARALCAGAAARNQILNGTSLASSEAN
jgi:hypothetical protein